MNIHQIRAVVRDVLAHHLSLHREQLADLLRYDRGVFALHDRDVRLARMIGELATQVAQGLADVAELSEAAAAWAKAEAECDALIDRSIQLAHEHRALVATCLVDMKAGAPQTSERDDALAELEKKIDTTDSLIALSCADVSKREATMKLLAKQIATADMPPPATATAAAQQGAPSLASEETPS